MDQAHNPSDHTERLCWKQATYNYLKSIRQGALLLPLAAATATLGALMTARQSPEMALSCAAAVGVSVVLALKLFLLQVDHRRLVRAEREMTGLYNATVRCLSAAIGARDCYNYDHVLLVEYVACAVAAEMGLSEDDQQGIRIASLLLDIGKLGVPENILLRAGSPSSEEFAAIHNHPIIGAQVLDSVPFPWPVAQAIRSHHERWDASGYPDRLGERNIPLCSRILAVADVYSAVTSNRAYRSGWTHKQAVDHIRKLSGIHFDPDVVQAFLKAEGRIIEYRNTIHTGSYDRANRAIARVNQEFVALWDISQTANSSLDLAETLHVVVKKVSDVLGCDAAAVFLADETGATMTCSAVDPDNAGHMLGASASIGLPGTGQVVRDRRPLIIRASKDELVDLDNKPFETPYTWAAIAPLRAGHMCLGTINLYRKDRDFTIQDLDLLDTLARHASIPVANACLFEQTRESAQRDVMTGLHNIRYFHSKMERELSRSERLKHNFSIIAIDLNNFKSVNDTLGHQAGDALLRDMAHLFTSAVREYDSVIRYGGDEFVVILPEAGPVEASEAVERLNDAVNSYTQRLSGLKSAGFGASFGCATYPIDGTDSGSLLAAADSRMYEHKRAVKSDQEAA